jgi:hypothetical protein
MAPKREHRPGDIVAPPVWEGPLTFGPIREPVGAGDGNTYVVRECGRCSEVHAEIERLQAALRDIWGQCNDPEGIHVDGIVEAIGKHAPDFCEVLACGPQENSNGHD